MSEIDKNSLIESLHYQLKEETLPAPYHGDLKAERHLIGSFTQQTIKHAAVLIPLIIAHDKNNDPHITLTKRADHLRAYPGHWSFPGGKTEDSDRNIFETAIRETKEEIGLASEIIKPLGKLQPYHTRTGYYITPIVGLIDQKPNYTINHDEVSEIIEIPLSYFMNQAHQKTKDQSLYGHPIKMPFFQYQEHHITGATAAILIKLREVIKAGIALTHERFEQSSQIMNPDTPDPA